MKEKNDGAAMCDDSVLRFGSTDYFDLFVHNNLNAFALTVPSGFLQHHRYVELDLVTQIKLNTRLPLFAWKYQTNK